MKIGDKLICKQGYFFNYQFFSGDVFIIEGFNEYNVRLKSKYNTFQNIRYSDRALIIKFGDMFLYDYFFTDQELRKEKLKKIQKINEKTIPITAKALFKIRRKSS